jgi:hypothetical protein
VVPAHRQDLFYLPVLCFWKKTSLRCCTGVSLRHDHVWTYYMEQALSTWATPPALSFYYWDRVLLCCTDWLQTSGLKWSWLPQPPE